MVGSPTGDGQSNAVGRIRRQACRIFLHAAALGLTFGVLAGTYPFLLGFAVALVALVCAATGRLWTAAALTLLTTLSHPLALVFLVIVLASFAVTTPGWWRPAAPRTARAKASRDHKIPRKPVWRDRARPRAACWR